MKPFNLYMVLTIMTIVLEASCKKADFLNTKPNQSLVLLSSVSDYQALLDNDLVMNGNSPTGTPSLGEVGADDYYVKDAIWPHLPNPVYQKSYIWATQLYSGQEIPDWDVSYQAIFYANSALDGLAKINVVGQNLAAYNNVKGSALFYRAHMFYQLAQVFAPPYKAETANTDFGIPLRLSSDINEKIQRASLQQTYSQIITDLTQSLSLLPTTPLYNTRPSRTAALALLSRVYQTMQDYKSALSYADSCLSRYNRLLDFNTINYAVTFPFTNNQYSDEIIFDSYAIISTNGAVPINTFASSLDSTLRKSYDQNDLRLPVYTYGPSFGFRGLYSINNTAFSGIATDEIYLIRAECYARLGDTGNAMKDLNTLLKTRWKTGTYVNYSAASSTDALGQILSERRKELPKRCLRWTDLRRLNLDPNFAVTLTRIYLGQAYTLPPNDPRYVYPIPDNVIALNPGMPQNNR